MKFKECETCPLFKARGPVFHDGDPKKAKIIYIAQNPAYEEIATGVPLSGPTGRVFNRQLYEARVPRSEVFITNQVKCETPGNRPPSLQEIKHCAWIVKKELELCKADVVVLAGQIAFDAHIGSYSTISRKYLPSNKIGERAGCVEVKDGRKWIGTVHPSSIMRQPKEWNDTIDTLKKAYMLSGKTLVEPDITIWADPPKINEVIQEILEKTHEYSIDVENATSIKIEEDDYVGGDQEITMCGISWKPRHAIVMSPHHLPLLKPLFEAEHVTQYEHNGSHDDFYLNRSVVQSRNKKFDTMGARHFHRSYSFKRLKPDCLSSYTLLPYYNRDLALIDEPLYNGYDVLATIESGRTLQRVLKEWQLYDLYMEYGQPLLAELEEWRVIGANVDVKKAVYFMEVLKRRVEHARSLLAKITGPWFNPNSPQQMQEFLYKQCGLPVQTKKATDKKFGGYKEIATTDTEAKRHLRDWINETQERQEQYKMARMFLDLTNIIEGDEAKMDVLNRISPDGKLHAFWKMHGASSFRIASSPNFQNWQKGEVLTLGTSGNKLKDSESPIVVKGANIEGTLRSIIIPDNPSTDILLTIDYEQIELWVYAVQFNCKKLLEIYDRGEYLYGFMYENLHKKPFFQPGKPRTKRYMLDTISGNELKRIKAVPLGFLYGRQAEEVAKEHGIPLDEAYRIQRWWFGELAPELIPAYDMMWNRASQDGYIRHVFGQVVHFPAKKKTEVYNSFGQSPAALLLISSIIKASKEIKRRNIPNARFILSVHDSVTLNVREDYCEELYEDIIAPIFSRRVPELRNYIFRHTADVSKTWDYQDIPYDEWKELRRSNQHDSRQAV